MRWLRSTEYCSRKTPRGSALHNIRPDGGLRRTRRRARLWKRQGQFGPRGRRHPGQQHRRRLRLDHRFRRTGCFRSEAQLNRRINRQCIRPEERLFLQSSGPRRFVLYTSPTAAVALDYNSGFLSLDNQTSSSYTVSSIGRVLTPASGTTQKVSYIIFPGKVITIEYSSSVTNPTVAIMEH